MRSSASTQTRANLPKGQRTREGILRAAVDLASVEGLEGLTIGRLADELKMSKSGLFAHFGSKEDLQLATVKTARQIFVDYVVHPALAESAGMPRLWSLCDRWLSHVERKVFAGGCFFTAASFEFDSRPGAVREAIVEAMQAWLNTLTRAVEDAKKAGHIKADINAAQFVLEIYSMAVGAHWALQLLDQKKAISTARETILARISSLATRRCPPLKIAG
ncbi:MAG TPA: TetR/AcrR family transcriptional regulator [Terriglobales bacterium]|jgi:AcrR family transcriptional regulator|nr:TetR/AcrR family transcriptional regulator [Terriglobales bacterium]